MACLIQYRQLHLTIVQIGAEPPPNASAIFAGGRSTTGDAILVPVQTVALISKSNSTE